MAEWLSFWNADTRAENEERLHGGLLESIYVPFGKGRIGRGDVVYCVGIQQGQLVLIARVRVATLDDDPEDEQSVVIEGADDDAVVTFDRQIPAAVVTAIEYEHADGSKHQMVAGAINPSRFQGRSSIRELSRGAAELDSIL